MKEKGLSSTLFLVTYIHTYLHLLGGPVHRAYIERQEERKKISSQPMRGRKVDKTLLAINTYIHTGIHIYIHTPSHPTGIWILCDIRSSSSSSEGVEEKESTMMHMYDEGRERERNSARGWSGRKRERTRCIGQSVSQSRAQPGSSIRVSSPSHER